MTIKEKILSHAYAVLVLAKVLTLDNVPSNLKDFVMAEIEAIEGEA